MGEIVDWILDFFFDLASFVIGWLPDSPFAAGQWEQNLNIFSNIMGYINYFIPIGWMLIIMTGYLSSILIWYGVRWVLRLARYIQ